MRFHINLPSQALPIATRVTGAAAFSLLWGGSQIHSQPRLLSPALDRALPAAQRRVCLSGWQGSHPSVLWPQL